MRIHLPFLSVLGFFLLISGFLAQEQDPQDSSPSISYKEIKDPRRISKRTGKPTLLIFYTNWSNNAARMRDEIFARPEIMEFLQSFHIERIDAETDKLGVDLRQLFEISTYPTILAYSEIERMGSLEGYWPPRTFLKRLRNWYEKWRTQNPKRENSLPTDPVLGNIDEETRTKRELREVDGFQLRTGKIVDGIPIKLSSGVVTLREGELITILPLYLFTPNSRKKVLAQAKSTMLKDMDLVPGPHGQNFQEISGIIEINELRNELSEPFIVLVDPKQEFLSILNDFLVDQPLKKNELSYIRKYRIAEDLSDRAFNLIQRKYSIELPAVMIVSSEGVEKAFSEVRMPKTFFDELKKIRVKATVKEQAAQLSSSE